jgi:CheY-like chemotaxis protein
MSQQPDTRTILIVEDNEDDYEAMMRGLELAHIENPVHWCKSGKDALDYLKHEGRYAGRPAQHTPGLILLDLNMPGIDGRKALALFKQDPRLRRIPVIVLTTSAAEDDIEKCYDLGASSYIQKPIDFDGLVRAASHIRDYWFATALLPKSAPLV